MNVNIDYYTNYEQENEVEKYESFLTEYRNKIEQMVKEALRIKKITATRAYVGIGIVTKPEIQSLNKEFRKVDRVTDVLSFPIFTAKEINNMYNKSIEEEISLGDIVICMDVVERQAEEYNTGFEREMLYMVAHGMCHLLGYDHEIESEKKEMRSMEETILSIIKE